MNYLDTIFFFGEGLPLNVLVMVVILGVFAGAIALVAILQFIKIIIKHRKKVKGVKYTQIDYLGIFGGIDNIVKVEPNLNRTLIEVRDKKQVNIEFLKQLNIGTQITGNVYKCSSPEMAQALENIKK